MSPESTTETVEVSVENVGGIEESHHTFEPGVTILTGQNATNRTSFLRAITAALGSTNASVRAGADEGRVTLRIGDRSYTRTLTPKGNNRTDARFDGEPYTDDTTAADLFAFLLSDNRTRRRVWNGDPDFADLVLAPVDTDAIETEIEQLTSEIRQVDDRIEELEQQEQNQVKLEERRQQLAGEIEDLSEEISDKEDRLEELEGELAASREQKGELQDAESTRQSVVSEVSGLEYELESAREQLAEKRNEAEDVESALAELKSRDDGENLDERIDTLEGRQEELQREVGELNGIIEFNEGLLDGSRPGLADALRGASESESETETAADLTGQLVTGTELVCWTCGQRTNESQVRGTLEALKGYREEKRRDRRDVVEELRELQSTRNQRRQRDLEREQMERTLSELQSEISSLETTTATLEERLEAKRDELADAEQRVEELETSETQDELLALRREISDLEGQRDTERRELDRVEEQLSELESVGDRRDELAEKRERLADERTAKRQYVDRLAEELVETFNRHMEEVLDVLEYENISRVWLERRKPADGDGSGGVVTSEFELQVVRVTPDGVSTGDRIENLSESEREVVGLVFALAGYLTHDVHEDVPFVLLDSLEAIDATRIARLVDHFAAYGTYTVVALLDEDVEPTAALDRTRTVVEEI